MNFKHRIAVAFSLFLLLVLYGCSAKPPQEEQRLAQRAKQQADEVQAAKLAVMDYDSAMKVFNDAEHAIKINRYGDAKLFYTRARSRFENSYKIAKSKRDDLQKEVAEARSNITSNYDKLKALMAAGKVPPKIKKSAAASCAEIDRAIAELDKAVTDGDFIKAKLTSKDILEKVYNTSIAVQQNRKAS